MASNENTPLSASGASPGGIDAISSFAKNVFTKENLENAGRVAKEKAIELKTQAQEGDQSLRLLALLGGVMVVVVSSMEFFGKLLTFNIIGALIAFFTLLLGIIVIILEGKSALLSTEFVNRIHEYASFLKFLWGRGCLYFICGTLQLYQFDLLNLVSGGYMCFVGVLFVLVGQRAATKLRSLRQSLSSEQTLHSKFAQADIDGDGGLNLQQFRTLTMSLGLDMTRRETEAAFMHIHKTDSEKLSYAEFQAWWSATDADEDINTNAFVFV
jgi:hypothetical protein